MSTKTSIEPLANETATLTFHPRPASLTEPLAALKNTVSVPPNFADTVVGPPPPPEAAIPQAPPPSAPPPRAQAAVPVAKRPAPAPKRPSPPPNLKPPANLQKHYMTAILASAAVIFLVASFLHSRWIGFHYRPNTSPPTLALDSPGTASTQHPPRHRFHSPCCAALRNRGGATGGAGPASRPGRRPEAEPIWAHAGSRFSFQSLCIPSSISTQLPGFSPVNRCA